MEVVIGETPNISEFMDFDFYQFTKYCDATSDIDDPIQLGRWLGIAHEVRTAMTYWVLKEKWTSYMLFHSQTNTQRLRKQLK
jgi:hypothetical protein